MPCHATSGRLDHWSSRVGGLKLQTGGASMILCHHLVEPSLRFFKRNAAEPV